MGLPSGLLWASQNVGADRQIDAGLYFSWGNVDGHTESDEYSFSIQDYTDSPGHQLDIDIDLAHDAARVNLGGTWRMPSRAEMVELLANCATQMTTIDGVYGCRVTSSINGAELFFPAVGYRYRSNTEKKGVESMIWSTTVVNTSYAYCLRLGTESTTANSPSLRWFGFNIRAVRDP